ncbi:hypothetical protein DUNSADRAFT_16177 [Dunaliella salina]|uniref:DUF4485 domain-containing protein n=1 Tax=Dunaliella salina TaxID=3046 RepID=A0ABQ7G435_DUNSA|nr:hypothetical protein DUNSADRAFT_16177 [Dunaliella salina]|eukprot:KAF5829374.1 hypothetical protein DUNSADRAFT_16177 [Dunaliella salina]
MEDGRLAAELDDAYSRAQAQIEALLGAPGPLNRGLRIRAKAWLSAMRMPTLNTVWKRNRNQHARLLLAQLRAGVLQAPFDALPPQNGLPTLQPWMIYRHGTNASPKRSSHCAATPRMEAHELRAGLTEADGRANLSDWRAGAAMSQMSKQDRELSAARQESEELMCQVSQSAAEHERAQGAAKVAAKSRLDALIETFEGRQAEWKPERISDATMPRPDSAATGAPTSFRDPALGAPSSYRGPAPGVPSRGSVSDVPSSYRDSVPLSPRSHRDPASDAPRSHRGPARSDAPSSYRDPAPDAPISCRDSAPRAPSSHGGPAPDAPSSYRDPAPNAPSSFQGSAPGAPRSHREHAPDAPSSHRGPTRSDAPSSYRDPASDVPSSYQDSGPNAPSSYQGSAPNSYRGPSSVPPSEPSLRGSLHSMPLSQSFQDPNQRIRRKLMELEDANAQFQRSWSAASQSQSGLSRSMPSSASRPQPSALQQILSTSLRPQQGSQQQQLQQQQLMNSASMRVNSGAPSSGGAPEAKASPGRHRPLYPAPHNPAAESQPDRPTSLNPNPMSTGITPSGHQPQLQQQAQQQVETRHLASQTNSGTQHTHAPPQTSLASLAPPSELPHSSSASHSSKASRALLPLKALSFTGATDTSTHANSTSSGGHPSTISDRSRAGSQREETARHGSTACGGGTGGAAGPGSSMRSVNATQQQQQQHEQQWHDGRAAGPGSTRSVLSTQQQQEQQGCGGGGRVAAGGSGPGSIRSVPSTQQQQQEQQGCGGQQGQQGYGGQQGQQGYGGQQGQQGYGGQQGQQGYCASGKVAVGATGRGSDRSARHSPVKGTQLLGDLQDLLHELDDVVGAEGTRPPSNVSLGTTNHAGSNGGSARNVDTHNGGRGSTVEGPGRAGTGSGSRQRGKLQGLREELQQQLGQQQLEQRQRNGTGGAAAPRHAPSTAVGSELGGSIRSGGSCSAHTRPDPQRAQQQQQEEMLRPRSAPHASPGTLPLRDPSFAFIRGGSNPPSPRSSRVAPLTLPSIPESPHALPSSRSQPLSRASSGDHQPPGLVEGRGLGSATVGREAMAASRAGSSTGLASVPTSNIHPSTIHSGTIHPSTIHSGTIHPSTIHPSTIHPSIIHPSIVHPSTIHPSTFHSCQQASSTHPPTSARWETQLQHQHKGAPEVARAGSSSEDAATHSTYCFSAASREGSAPGVNAGGGLASAAAVEGTVSGAFGSGSPPRAAHASGVQGAGAHARGTLGVGAHASGMHSAPSGAFGEGRAPGGNSSSTRRAGSPISEQRLASPRLRISPDPILLTQTPGHRYVRCPFSAPASRETSPARCPSRHTHSPYGHPAAKSPPLSPTRSHQHPHSPYRHRPPNYHELPSNTTAFPYYPATVPGRSPSAPPSRRFGTSTFGDLNLPAQSALFRDPSSPTGRPGARLAAPPIPTPAIFRDMSPGCAAATFDVQHPSPSSAIFRDTSPGHAGPPFGIEPAEGGLAKCVPPFSGAANVDSALGTYTGPPSHTTSACPPSTAAADRGSCIDPPMPSSSSRPPMPSSSCIYPPLPSSSSSNRGCGDSGMQPLGLGEPRQPSAPPHSHRCGGLDARAPMLSDAQRGVERDPRDVSASVPWQGSSLPDSRGARRAVPLGRHSHASPGTEGGDVGWYAPASPSAAAMDSYGRARGELGIGRAPGAAGSWAPPGTEGGNTGWYAPASPSAAATAKDGFVRTGELGIDGAPGAAGAGARCRDRGAGMGPHSGGTGCGRESLEPPAWNAPPPPPATGGAAPGAPPRNGGSGGAAGTTPDAPQPHLWLPPTPNEQVGLLTSRIPQTPNDQGGPLCSSGITQTTGPRSLQRHGSQLSQGSHLPQGSHLSQLSELPAGGGEGLGPRGAMGSSINAHNQLTQEQQQQQQQRQGSAGEGEGSGALGTSIAANNQQQWQQRHHHQQQKQRQGSAGEGEDALLDSEEAWRMHLQRLCCRELQEQQAAMGPQAQAEQQFEHARQVGLQERLRGQQELLLQQKGHNPAFFAGSADHEGDGKEIKVAGGYGGALLRERPAAIQQRVNEAVLVGSRTVAMRAAHADGEMSTTHKRVSELEVQVWNSKHQLDDLVEIAHQLGGGLADQGESDLRLSPGRKRSNTGAKQDVGPAWGGGGAGSNPLRTSMGLSMQAALSVGHMCFAPLLPPRAGFALSTSFSQFWAALANLRAKLSLVPSEVEGALPLSEAILGCMAICNDAVKS